MYDVPCVHAWCTSTHSDHYFDVCCHLPVLFFSRIRNKDCTLLKTLGNYLPYEIAIGMNGRIWVKGRSSRETILIMNAISNSEFMTNDQMKTMVKGLLDALQGF